jgi:hypothetical protein
MIISFGLWRRHNHRQRITHQRCGIQPAFFCPNRGYVRCPFLIEGIRCKVLFQQIRRNGQCMMAIGCGLVFPGRFGSPAVASHDSGPSMSASRYTFCLESSSDSGSIWSAFLIIKNAFKGFSQLLIGLFSTGKRPVSPAVSHYVKPMPCGTA